MTQGNDGEAEELLVKALLVIGETGHLIDRIEPLDALGRLAQRQGDYALAQTLHEEGLALCIEMEHPARLSRTLEAFACLAARQGQADAAAHLFGATEMYPALRGERFDPLNVKCFVHWHRRNRPMLSTRRPLHYPPG